MFISVAIQASFSTPRAPCMDPWRSQIRCTACLAQRQAPRGARWWSARVRGGCPRPDRHRCPPPRWKIVSGTPSARGAVRAAPPVPRLELACLDLSLSLARRNDGSSRSKSPARPQVRLPAAPSAADGPGPCVLRRYCGGTIWLPPGGAALTVAFGAHRTRCSAIYMPVQRCCARNAERSD